jgi:hypothetical protein
MADYSTISFFIHHGVKFKMAYNMMQASAASSRKSRFTSSYFKTENLLNQANCFLGQNLVF